MRKLLALWIVAAFLSLAASAYALSAEEDLRESLTVVNWRGDRLGTVWYLVVDPSSEVVDFAILQLEKEEKEIAVPMTAFSSFNWETRILVLNASEKELASAPEYQDSDLNDPAYAGRVYGFFGVAPTWTGEPLEWEDKAFWDNHL